MYNVLLVIVVFLGMCFIGYIISGTKRECVKCKEVGTEMVISYRGRTVYVILDRNCRIPAYRRKGSYEFLTVPAGKGSTTVEQMEHWVTRARPSLLVRGLFRFSQLSHPVELLRFDPEYGNELSTIQQKLYSFLRM